jgi:hypothetical protein
MLLLPLTVSPESVMSNGSQDLPVFGEGEGAATLDTTLDALLKRRARGSAGLPAGASPAASV